MDRFEEIKTMDHDSEFGSEEYEWLISEIERLRKALQYILIMSDDDRVNTKAKQALKGD